MTTFIYLLALIPFYLLGAFPSGYLIARQHGVKIAAHGSGNVGATNLARVLGWKAGGATLLIDVTKGLLAVLIAQFLFGSGDAAVFAAVAVVLGHCFSLPGYLKGGKGVATALGACIVLAPGSTLAALIVFALLLWRTRYVSLASVSAALFAPLVAMFSNSSEIDVLGLAVIALVIAIRHSENYRRILEWTEPKLEELWHEGTGVQEKASSPDDK